MILQFAIVTDDDPPYSTNTHVTKKIVYLISVYCVIVIKNSSLCRMYNICIYLQYCYRFIN